MADITYATRLDYRQVWADRILMVGWLASITQARGTTSYAHEPTTGRLNSIIAPDGSIGDPPEIVSGKTFGADAGLMNARCACKDEQMSVFVRIK